tara:strand:- start:10462 stop:11043 length:582 start_codon:yes stop_codon:yes gene_type:complete
LKSFISFIVKTSFVYACIAFAFSLLGLLLPNAYVIGNPLVVSNISFEHVMGHIVWGLVVGIVSFSLRYAIIAGLFPIILDVDHLLQFLDVEMIPRMAHSVPFAFLAIIIMMIIFGRKDLRLIAVSFAAVLTHISFDIFLSGWTKFPILAPFNADFFVFAGYDWIIFEVVAMAIVATSSLIFFVKQKSKHIFSL